MLRCVWLELAGYEADCILQERLLLLLLLNPAFTMELQGRGRGGTCREDGSRNGGSMGGTKDRLSGWKGDVHVWPGLSDFDTISANLPIIPEQ